MHPIYNYIKESLAPVYPDGETSAMAKWILTDVFGLSVTDLYTGKDNDFPAEKRKRLEDILGRLRQHEPLQYILESASFCGFPFRVDRNVLIPRPETEELVDWIVKDHQRQGVSILDIGTGSGCIAISLARLIHGASVSAWDISEGALGVAAENARMNEVKVKFSRVDVLGEAIPDGCYDVVVSNPPYITMSEKKDMEDNVTGWEPHTALFVPDADPLLFYRRIAEISGMLLNDGGTLYFEINRAYGAETTAMMKALGYVGVELHKDIFGNDRMVKGVWKKEN